ncbi:MAG: hypothetical protein Q9223_004906 [Gallowayella weberi]
MTRRVPTAVRTAVTFRTCITAWPARSSSSQLFRLRMHTTPATSIKIASFSQSAPSTVDGRLTGASKEPPQKGDDAPETDINEAIAQEKEKQTRAPWHRQGSNTPPVARQRSAGAMTKETVTAKTSNPLPFLSTPNNLSPTSNASSNPNFPPSPPLAVKRRSQQSISAPKTPPMMR